MTNKKLIALLSLSPFLGAPAAFAQQPVDRPLPYDFAHASIAVTELDTGGLEGGVSFTVAPNLHVFASYQDWEINSGVDRSILQVGAGYHWDIAQNLDLLVGLAFADSTFDPPGPAKSDDTGLILSAGLRGWLTDTMELSGTILLDDSLESGTDTVLELGGQYYMSNQFSLGGRARIDENDTTLFFGGRFYFGRGN